jgi:hypothetical protein
MVGWQAGSPNQTIGWIIQWNDAAFLFCRHLFHADCDCDEKRLAVFYKAVVLVPVQEAEWRTL